MVSSHSQGQNEGGASHQWAFNSASSSSWADRRFSWKRVLKVLSCLVSVFWVVMLHVSTANAGGLNAISTDLARLVIAAVTTIAAVPILLFLRGPLKYALGVPFVLLALWTAWGLLAMLGQPAPPG